MPNVSGFQVVFLAFAVQFFASLAASATAARLALPREALELLGQAIFFSLVILILAGVKPLRRYCIEELSRKISPDAYGELAFVSVAKTSIPFAAMGAVVLWAFLIGEPTRIASELRVADPVKMWEWTLSPLGLVRLVVFAWIVGPIVEELLFRGLVYRAWERQWGWLPSLFLTSACFSFFHGFGTVTTFVTSVVCICVLRRTGSLRASIVVHMAYNVLISWPLLGQMIPIAARSEPSRLSAWVPPLVCLIFLAIALPAYLAMSRTDARTATAAPARSPMNS